MTGQIVAQRTSYRHGLVLGLTMAEVMLLLVFCLLMALASFLRVEQARSTDLDRQLKDERLRNERDRKFIASIQQNPILADRLRDLTGQGDSSAIDEFWRDLVDSRSLTAELKRDGVSLEGIRERVSDVSILRRSEEHTSE